MSAATQVGTTQDAPGTSASGVPAPASYRTTAVVAGVLFIVATVAAVVAAGLTPALTEPDYLSQLSAHQNETAAGAFLYLVAAFASAGIAIALFRVLKETGAGLARGSVVFRGLEAAMYMVAIVALLSLLTLGQQFTSAGADRTGLQMIGDQLVSVRDHASLAGVFAFCLGGSLYYFLLYRSRLIPRWLSGWGIAGVVLMLVACMMALFSDNPVNGYIPLALPIGVQELVLGAWLIVKGFNGVARSAPSGR